MKLEEQVVGLELAKRLMELGVRHAPSFWWVDWKDADFQLISDEALLEEADPIDQYPAYTVAELGEMLPKGYVSYRSPNGVDGWFCWVEPDGKTRQQAPTEADARGKMLIYLLENKLITL
jgi:hypothetical protein